MPPVAARRASSGQNGACAGKENCGCGEASLRQRAQHGSGHQRVDVAFQQLVESRAPHGKQGHSAEEGKQRRRPDWCRKEGSIRQRRSRRS